MANEKDKDQLKAEELSRQIEEERRKLQEDLNLAREEDLENEEESDEKNVDDDNPKKEIKEKPRGKVRSTDDIEEDDRLERELDDPFDGNVLIEDDLHDESLDELEEAEKEQLLNDEIQRQNHQEIIDAKQQTRLSFEEYHKKNVRFQKEWEKRNLEDEYSKSAKRSFGKYSSNDLKDKKEIETFKKDESTLKSKLNKDFIEIDGVKVKVEDVDNKELKNKTINNNNISKDALDKYYSGTYRNNAFDKKENAKSADPTSHTRGFGKVKRENLLDEKYDFSKKSVKELLSKNKKIPVNDLKEKAKFNEEQIRAIQKVNKTLLLNQALLKKIDLEEVSNIITSFKGVDNNKLDKILGLDKNKESEKKSLDNKNKQDKIISKNIRDKKAEQKARETIKSRANLNNREKSIADIKNINKPSASTLKAQESSSVTNLIYRRNKLNEDRENRAYQTRQLNNRRIRESLDRQNLQKNKGIAETKKIEDDYVAKNLAYEKYIRDNASINRESLRVQRAIDRRVIRTSARLARATVLGTSALNEKRIRDGYNKKNLRKTKISSNSQRRVNLSDRYAILNSKKNVYDKYKNSTFNRKALETQRIQRRIAKDKAQSFIINNKRIKEAYAKQAKTIGIARAKKIQDDKFRPQSLGHEKYGNAGLRVRVRNKNNIDDTLSNEKAQKALNRKIYQKRAFDTRRKINDRIAKGKMGSRAMLKTPGYSTATQNAIAGISSLATISARRNLLKRRYEVATLKREDALRKSGRLNEVYRKKKDLENSFNLDPRRFKSDFNGKVKSSRREEERLRFKQRDKQRLKTAKDKGLSSNVRGKNEEELLSKTRLDKELSDKLKTDKLLSDKVKGPKDSTDLAGSAVDSASEYSSNKDNQTEEGKNAQKAERKLRQEILKRNKGAFSNLGKASGSASTITGKGIVSSNRAGREYLSKATKDNNLKMNNLDVVKGRNGKQTLTRDKDIIESKNVESGLVSKERRDARFLQENRFERIKSNLELEKGIKEKKSATDLYQDAKNAKGKSIDVGGKKDEDLLINKINSPYNRAPKDSITKTKPTLSDKILSKSNRVNRSGKINMGNGKMKNDRSSNTFSNFADKAKMDRKMIDRFQSKNALGRFMAPTSGSFAPNPFAMMKKVAAKGTIATSLISKGLSSVVVAGLAAGGSAGGTVGPTNARSKGIDHYFDTVSAKFNLADNKEMSFTQDAVYMAQARMKVYYKQIANEEPTAEELAKAGVDLLPLKEIEVKKATLDGQPIDPKSFDLYKLKNAKLFGGTVVSLNIKYIYVKEDWETLIGKDNFILDEYSDIQFPDGSGGALAAPTVISGGGGFIVGGALRGEENMEQIRNFFKDQGFTDAGVAGIMGNLAHESGLDSGRLQNGGGPGHGLAQWEGPRWTNLQNFARQRGKDWSDLGTQLQFMMSELRDYPALVQALRNATNPQDAAVTFEQIYERAGIKSYDERTGRAQEIYNKRDSLTVPKGSTPTTETTPAGTIGLNLFRDFIMPTAYADREGDDTESPSTETSPDDKDNTDTETSPDDKDKDKNDEEKDPTATAEDDLINSLPSISGLGMMSSEESIGQIVFLKDMLSLSALGAMYKDPKKMEDYKRYCLDIVDYAVTGEGAKGKTKTAIVDFVSYIVEDEEGNKTKLITASVKLPVMCDLRTLEDNDKNFNQDWDLKFGGSGPVQRKVNNGDKYGDRMPQRYMALHSSDFNHIFKVNIQPSSFASGLMNAGGFLFNVADFEGATGIPYVDWAISIANNPAHGYSQYNRNGNPDYDCSSLVFYSLKAAGFPVGDSAFATFSMLGDLQAIGFTAIPFSFDALQPGDVVLNPGSHTEIYVGGGMTVGAKSSHEGDGIHGAGGDQSGEEIKVDQMWSSYEWILRPPADYMQKVTAERETKKKNEEAKKKAEADKKKQDEENRKKAETIVRP